MQCCMNARLELSDIAVLVSITEVHCLYVAVDLEQHGRTVIRRPVQTLLLDSIHSRFMVVANTKSLGAAVQFHNLKPQVVEYLLFSESLAFFVDGKNRRIAGFIDHAGNCFSDVSARSFLELRNSDVERVIVSNFGLDTSHERSC